LAVKKEVKKILSCRESKTQNPWSPSRQRFVLHQKIRSLFSKKSMRRTCLIWQKVYAQIVTVLTANNKPRNLTSLRLSLSHLHQLRPKLALDTRNCLLTEEIPVLKVTLLRYQVGVALKTQFRSTLSSLHTMILSLHSRRKSRMNLLLQRVQWLVMKLALISINKKMLARYPICFKTSTT